MKSRSVFRVAVALLVVVASFAASAQSNVQVLADRWVVAYNKHDRAALGALYTDDAQLMMHGSATIGGRSRIESFWSEDFKVDNPLTLLTVTHSVQGSDLTLVHGNYRVISRADGKELGAGRFAHIWTKAGNGEWRLDRDLWSEAFDPYGPGNPMEGDVQSLADRWVAAYNKHDRAALQGLYTEGARLMMHGAPTIAGRADIGAFWAQDFQEGNPLTLLDVTHGLEGVDMILVHGNYQVVDRSDGSRVGLGRFAHIWTRDRNGEWRLDRDLWQERSEPVVP
jgi:ketosteroid isomerase-like protein